MKYNDCAKNSFPMNVKQLTNIITRKDLKIATRFVEFGIIFQRKKKYDFQFAKIWNFFFFSSKEKKRIER